MKKKFKNCNNENIDRTEFCFMINFLDLWTRELNMNFYFALFVAFFVLVKKEVQIEENL